jgi:hypothetical protein
MRGNFPGAGIMQSFEPLNYSTTIKLALPKWNFSYLRENEN